MAKTYAKTYTEEEFEQEMLQALAENRKPRFKGQDAQEEKRKQQNVTITDVLLKKMTQIERHHHYDCTN